VEHWCRGADQIRFSAVYSRTYVYSRTTTQIQLVRFTIHSGVCTFNPIGASPSLTGVLSRSAACRITVIFLRAPGSPSSSSLRHSRDVTSSAAISGSCGIFRRGYGTPLPNPTCGSRVPNERIHCPTPARETRTSQDPPSWSVAGDLSDLIAGMENTEGVNHRDCLTQCSVDAKR
jgi:hypothetical protein